MLALSLPPLRLAVFLRVWRLERCGETISWRVPLYALCAQGYTLTVPISGTVRAIGFVQLASCLFANVFLRSRLPPRRSGSMVEWAAFKELEYTFYVTGSFFVG